jgi:hypothetical protein
MSETGDDTRTRFGGEVRSWSHKRAKASHLAAGALRNHREASVRGPEECEEG